MSVTVGDGIRAAAARLAAKGVSDARRDARRLMAAAIGVSPDRLILADADPLSPEVSRRLEPMIAARETRQPVSQILGRRAFWDRDFNVSRDVLDPRPETETLIELALGRRPARRVLDLGTGSGAILVTLLAEWPAATGLGTDMSVDALAVARGNAVLHGVEARAAFIVADWLDGVEGPFDLVVSNPPYIAEAELADLEPEVWRWEPAMALSPGPDGLAACRRIAAGLARVMAPDGRALIEIGAGQGRAARAVFGTAGRFPVRIHRDLDGRDRVIEIGGDARTGA